MKKHKQNSEKIRVNIQFKPQKLWQIKMEN
ncbi:hypothetical protein SVIOM342S_06173 [Streptomyces violaceorubidus]